MTDGRDEGRRRARAAGVALAVALGVVAAHGATAQPAAPQNSIGRFQVATLPFDPRLPVRTATYTPSGKVLVQYGKAANEPRRQVNLATVDDDGRNMRPFFSAEIPVREKDNGLRFMVFPDNKRIFLGDFVIECRTSLETCQNPALLPVDYPVEVASGDHVGHRWSEMIVAPDNKHVAWTTLLANYSAIVFTGELRKQGARYKIVAPQIVSTLDNFRKDPAHPDGMLPVAVRGGEVKQFVHGGTGISLAGAMKRDVPDSVVQHLAGGEIEAITDTPGYDETTIFSPDERLGITMTDRFSDRTGVAILGLMPRPYPAALNVGLGMPTYTYAVTGVRGARPGNIGPALIDIAASKTQPGYKGIDLHTSDEWVFRSPMSWHPGGARALWPEGRRGDGQVRIQIVRLLDHRPAAPVRTRAMPRAPYGSSDMALVQPYARTSQAIDVKVYGRKSGYLTYRRTPAGIEKRYVDFSDDGVHVYAGSETMATNPRGRSTYDAEVRLTGPKPGAMRLKMTFGPIDGELPAQLIFAPDASGTPLTHGYVDYDGQRLEASSLIP